jgi:predicted porin
MNKKLIAVAIAAAVAAPAAMANDTILYGKAHVSVQYNDNIDGTTNDNYTANSNASRLGVKGSEDLGDGLKAIYGYEMGYNITDTNGGESPISARNAYVGLAGDFGTFLVGRHDTPAKIAWYSAGNDIIGDSIVDFNKVAGTAKIGDGSDKLSVSTFTEIRADNAIAYVTPSFSGFTGAAAVVPGEGKNGSNNGLADAYSLALMYSGNGLKGSVGYEVFTKDFITGLGLQFDNPTPPPALLDYSAAKDQKMWQASVSYTFGDFQIGGSYEHDSDYAGIDNAKRTAYGFAGKYTLGNNYVMANWGKTDGKDGAEALLMDASGYGLGVGHKFSKRTQVYVAYHKTDYKDDAEKDPSSFALGMIHSF